MHPAGERKCPHCEGFFVPDARNRKRQHYCAKAPCRRASKAASQRRWLERAENADYFRGGDNAARVRAWQAAHPGYWKKRRPRSLVVLQDDCPMQTTPVQQVAAPDGGGVLQDDWLRQPPLVIGLIAHLAGVTLQEGHRGNDRSLASDGACRAGRVARLGAPPMLIAKRILQAERLRRVPPHFSWIDHRLVREGYLRGADAKAWALYLVLVTVGDEHGLSYYGDGTLGRMLALTDAEVAVARAQLVAAGVIAHETPLYRVLSLQAPPSHPARSIPPAASPPPVRASREERR